MSKIDEPEPGTVCVGEEVLLAFARGQLAPAELPPVEDHLDSCRSCSELLALYSKMSPLSADDGEPMGAADELARGTLVGRYTVLGRLGQGNMGVVYGAYDPDLDRKVVLKLLKGNAGARDPRSEARVLLRVEGLVRLA